eukprot:Selendium_serpulae@DN6279_c0_g1_i1.p1
MLDISDKRTQWVSFFGIWVIFTWTLSCLLDSSSTTPFTKDELSYHKSGSAGSAGIGGLGIPAAELFGGAGSAKRADGEVAVVNLCRALELCSNSSPSHPCDERTCYQSDMPRKAMFGGAVRRSFFSDRLHLDPRVLSLLSVSEQEKSVSSGQWDSGGECVFGKDRNGDCLKAAGPGTGSGLSFLTSSRKMLDLPNVKDACPHHITQWAVMTTISDMTDNQAVARVLAAGWCIVVVSDSKTPTPMIEDPKFVFLSASDQEAWAEKSGGFIDDIPWRHFGRKNIGYIYAMKRGAELIFDVDDDNELLLVDGRADSPLPPMPKGWPTAPEFEMFDVWEVEPAVAVMNPYSDLKPTNKVAWPRGYPIQNITLPQTLTRKPKQMSRGKIGIYQAVAQGDPDVDAIFRLTERPVNFDFKEKPDAVIVVPPHLFTPTNAQAAVYLRSAFWAMLLPITVPGRVSDIWRSYFGQAMRLQFSDSPQTAFMGPRVVQHRNAHNYLADMEAEDDLYFKTTELIAFLTREFECSEDAVSRFSFKPDVPRFARCLLVLYASLYERKYVDAADVSLMAGWLRLLIASDIPMPSEPVH